MKNCLQCVLVYVKGENSWLQPIILHMTNIQIPTLYRMRQEEQIQAIKQAFKPRSNPSFET